jgi:hypothetical protein
MRLCGQETNSNASGIVLSQEKEIVAGATVTVIHEPTQSRYISALGTKIRKLQTYIFISQVNIFSLKIRNYPILFLRKRLLHFQR